MRGIDAETEFDSICTVRKFAKKTHAVVVITGERDIVTDGDRMYMIENGCKEMSLLTGTGCICSALTGLFLGAGYEGGVFCCSGSSLCGDCR